MKKIIYAFILFLLPLISICQTSYDKQVQGAWDGIIYGGGLPEKKITIVITKSNYASGVCEGYSLVNNSNKTGFKGTMIVEADLPIIEGDEPKTNPKNGKFHLEFGCMETGEILDDMCCGTWVSYDKKIKRKIKVERSKK